MELRRELSLTSLTLTVVTGTIGSGWLFASYYAARRQTPDEQYERADPKQN